MKSTKTSPSHSFQSKLERISDEAEYFALSVPEKITKALKTKAAVPILAKVNDSKEFRGSLFPVGEGRHYMRVKAEVRNAAKIKEGDKVRVEISVVDRESEISIPKDLAKALKDEGVLEAFQALTAAKKSYMLRFIDQASKPETRKKRIESAVETAHEKKEKSVKS